VEETLTEREVHEARTALLLSAGTRLSIWGAREQRSSDSPHDAALKIYYYYKTSHPLSS